MLTNYKSSHGIWPGELKKPGRYGNPQHTFFTNGIYFVQKNYVPLRILSSLHKATKLHIFMM